MKKFLTALLALAAAVMFSTALWAPTIDPPAPPEKCNQGCNSGHAFGKYKDDPEGNRGENVRDEVDEGDQDPGNSGNQSQGGKNDLNLP